jgi:hypothetical protein
MTCSGIPSSLVGYKSRRRFLKPRDSLPGRTKWQKMSDSSNTEFQEFLHYATLHWCVLYLSHSK